MSLLLLFKGQAVAPEPPKRTSGGKGTRRGVPRLKLPDFTPQKLRLKKPLPSAPVYNEDEDVVLAVVMTAVLGQCLNDKAH